MDNATIKVLEEMDALLAVHTTQKVDVATTLPESVAVFPPSAAKKVSASPVVSQVHSHIAPPIL